MHLLLVLALGSAFASGKKDAKALFEAYVAQEAAFDPAMFALFTPDAQLVVTRSGVTKPMPVATVAARAEAVMVQAREANDRNSYRKVKYARQADGWLITAVRLGSAKCYEDESWHLVLEEAGDGMKIRELAMSTPGISHCAPAPALGAALTALHDEFAPRLPIDIDEDTRLESVELVGSSLIFRQHLHGWSREELEQSLVDQVFSQLAVQHACAIPTMRSATDQGAHMFYVTVDRDRKPLKEVLVTKAACEAMGL